MAWKKGRGRLGVLEPLLGTWVAEAESKLGHVRCSRDFTRVLGGNYIQLRAHWEFGEGGPYEELALLGIGDDKQLCYWSYTSDGKRSTGVLADVTDLDANAVGFHAEMPAGLARQAYWPHPGSGFIWVVESKVKRGWNRFVEHHYRPL